MSKQEPKIELRSVVVKTISDNTYRHFFRWDNPKTKERVNLRMELIGEDGKLVVGIDGKPSHSLIGFLIHTTGKQQNGPFISVDAPMIATGFQYWTASINGSTAKVMALINERREDLRGHNAAIAGFELNDDESLIRNQLEEQEKKNPGTLERLQKTLSEALGKSKL